MDHFLKNDLLITGIAVVVIGVALFLFYRNRHREQQPRNNKKQ